MARCKRRLAALWLIGTATIVSVVMAQIARGVYEFYEVSGTKVWNWLLPSIMPSLALIVGALVADALGHDAGIKTADRFMFRVCMGLSLLYLGAVAIPVFAFPIAALSPPQLMENSSIVLGAFQGLVSATLGVFFLKNPQRRSSRAR